MTGSNVIASFAHAVAAAKTQDELSVASQTFRRDIGRTGVREACLMIFYQRKKELGR